MAVRHVTKRSTPKLAQDLANVRKVLGAPQRNFLVYGTVGHTDDLTGAPEPTPQFVRLEQGQVFVEVTIQPDGDEIVARLGTADAGPDSGQYLPLDFGCRVVLELMDGNPNRAVITARLWDSNCNFPSTVAGISTGAAGATAPNVGVAAPMWQFVKTPSGQLIAVETGTNGDWVVHVGTGGGVWMKVASGSAVHLDAIVHLGSAPLTPPVGATVGPAGTQLPGVAMVPRPPILTPHVPPTVPTPKLADLPPFVGDRDGIVRVKDSPQSDLTIDSTFWTWLTAAAAALAALGVAVPTPLSITCDHRSGSKHTASD